MDVATPITLALQDRLEGAVLYNHKLQAWETVNPHTDKPLHYDEDSQATYETPTGLRYTVHLSTGQYTVHSAVKHSTY